MPRAVRSAFLCVFLVLALAVPPALAGVHRQTHPARSAPKAAVSTSPVSRAWSALLSLFGRSGAEMGPDGMKTASAAPGSHTTTKPLPTTDSGGTMDPDG